MEHENEKEKLKNCAEVQGTPTTNSSDKKNKGITGRFQNPAERQRNAEDCSISETRY